MTKFSYSKILSFLIGVSVFVGCQSVMAVPIYRGVDASPNGRASLAPGQFNFNPTLSTFDLPANAPVQKPCNYQFDVTGGNLSPIPVVGEHGDITGPGLGLPGYTATFDDNPHGHWGITQPNGVSADQAKAAVSLLAQANRGNVVNGTQVNCN